MNQKNIHQIDNLREVAIVDGVRTPFVKAGDKLASLRAQDLGRIALKELTLRLHMGDGFSGQTKVDEVVIGNVGGPVDASNVSRVIALSAGLHKSIPAYTVNRNCASGMESVAQAWLKIATGYSDVMLVGGAESMSNLPLLFNKKMTGLFMNMFKAKTASGRLRALLSFRLPFLKPIIAVQEALVDPLCGLNMGQTAEILAREFQISREDQDHFAMESHRKSVVAQESGWLGDEIVPVPVPPKYKSIVTDDIGPRKNLVMEKMAKFRPYFDRVNGTVTVANSCSITDGAAALALMPLSMAKERGYSVLGKIRGISAAGLEPQRMGLGPVYATAKVMDQTGLSLDQMDVIEVNEAFSVQVLAVMKAMNSKKFANDCLGRADALGEIDPGKLNQYGGAVALGHPVGASGTRILLTALKQLERTQKQFSLSTLCVGGGQGQSIIMERVV